MLPPWAHIPRRFTIVSFTEVKKTANLTYNLVSAPVGQRQGKMKWPTISSNERLTIFKT